MNMQKKLYKSINNFSIIKDERLLFFSWRGNITEYTAKLPVLLCDVPALRDDMYNLGIQLSLFPFSCDCVSLKWFAADLAQRLFQYGDATTRLSYTSITAPSAKTLWKEIILFLTGTASMLTISSDFFGTVLGQYWHFCMRQTFFLLQFVQWYPLEHFSCACFLIHPILLCDFK